MYFIRIKNRLQKTIGKEENVFIVVSDIICKRIYMNMKCLGRQLDIRSV